MIIHSLGEGGGFEPAPLPQRVRALSPVPSPPVDSARTSSDQEPDSSSTLESRAMSEAIGS